jgi:DNA-binding CsgD family transcriptional regulator
MGHNSRIQTLDRSVELLSGLTAKQRDVLDLVLRHKSSKEIAHALQISPYTVDQRISAARRKLGVSSRGELARAYSRYLEICEETAYGISYVADEVDTPQMLPRDQPVDPVFMLSDATSISMELPWHLQPEMQFGLGAIDNKFGILGRVLIIPLLAVLIALLALAMTAIAMILPAVF